MSDASASHPSDWLTVPEIAAAIDEPVGRVRRLLEEQHLIVSRRYGAPAMPALFLFEGQPLGSLRGTIIALHDVGFDADETIDWLLAEEDSLGRSPIDALRAGHKSAVRRLARTLL